MFGAWGPSEPAPPWPPLTAPVEEQVQTQGRQEQALWAHQSTPLPTAHSQPLYTP